MRSPPAGGAGDSYVQRNHVDGLTYVPGNMPDEWCLRKRFGRALSLLGGCS